MFALYVACLAIIVMALLSERKRGSYLYTRIYNFNYGNKKDSTMNTGNLKCCRCKKRDAEILLHSNGTVSAITGGDDIQIPLCTDPLCIRITVYNMIGLMMDEEEVQNLIQDTRSEEKETIRKVQEILGMPVEIVYTNKEDVHE